MLVAVAMLFPLVLHLGTRVASAPGAPKLQRAEVAWAGSQPKGGIPAAPADPMQSAWEIAWDGHAVLHHPGRFWTANRVWPLKNNLAFSDAYVGYAPAGFVGSGPHAAIVRYNVLLILSFAFAALGAYALARALGASAAGAAVAGAAYGFNPWRIAQIGHLHVLTSGGIPLALALLVHGYRRRSPAAILAGWLVATWQLSIGFSLGLPFAYLLAVLAVGAVVVLARRGRQALPPRPVLWSTAAGGLLFVGAGIVLARPYLAVLHDFPESGRSIADVIRFSPRLSGLFAAPRHDVLWGVLLSHPRSRLNWPEEQTLFPGLAVLVLAGYCLMRARSVFGGRLVTGLAAGVIVTTVLALGLGPGRAMPYRLLFEFAPGWDGVRTPGRIFTLALLGLALLAAGGVTALQPTWRRGLRRALPVVVVVVVLAEGFGLPPLLRPPAPVKARLEAPVFFLPPSDITDSAYLLWSTDGFPDLVNGTASFRPAYTNTVRELGLIFPGAPTPSIFRSAGVRTIVVDRRLARGTPWQGTAARSTAGLPVKREEAGPWVIYRLAG